VLDEDGRTPEAASNTASVPPWPICPVCGKGRHTSCPACGTSGNQFPPGDAGFPPIPGDAGETDPARPLWICPLCDEPFEAAFLRRCEWCGHDFGDGIARPVPAREASGADAMNLHVWLVVAGLAATLLTGLIYFLSIAP